MPRTLALLVALAVGASAARADKAPPRAQPGQLDVYDEAKLFSPAGIDKAKEAFRATEFHNGLAVTVDTVTAPPAGKMRGEAEAAHRDEAKWRAFMTAWARDTAKADKAKGIYVLVTLQPVGGIAVLADAQTTRRGFTEADDRKVREIFAAAFKEARDEPDETKKQAIRSAALVKAVEYIAADLKDTRVSDAAGGEKRDHGPGHADAPRSPVMGYLCFGLVGLAGVWLVIAVVRAFSGGGGGGMGGGGGGFFPSLLGGLFGAAAGMWMYSHFFGGGGGMFGGSDAYAGDAGGGDTGGGDTGAGDWGGGSADAGGFDAGGGGDFGGGGGDFGGDF